MCYLQWILDQSAYRHVRAALLMNWHVYALCQSAIQVYFVTHLLCEKCIFFRKVAAMFAKNIEDVFVVACLVFVHPTLLKQNFPDHSKLSSKFCFANRHISKLFFCFSRSLYMLVVGRECGRRLD